MTKAKGEQATRSVAHERQRRSLRCSGSENPGQEPCGAAEFLGVGGASFLAQAHSVFFTPAHLRALIASPKFDPLALIVNPPRE